jgi:hypothetical protein
MESKRHFQRVTIDEMKQRRAEMELERKLAELMSYIDQQIEEAVGEVMNELGYVYDNNMTYEEIKELHEQLEREGISFDVDTQQVGSKYIANIKVSQLARTLEFDLGGDDIAKSEHCID